MIKNLLCWCMLAFVAISCDESFVTPDPEARGLNYYPLEVGNYRVYNVTDIKYQHNVATEERFQMREWVADSFLDQTNTLTYKIIRSIRPNAQSEWLDDSVMTLVKTNNHVILTKDNTKYVKLVFPVEEGKTWQPDMFNVRNYESGRKEVATYSAVDKPSESGAFEETVTVKQEGKFYSPDAGVDDRQEVYARGVGLVYRLFKRLDYEECTIGCENPEILDGHERREELIDYGKL